MLSGRILDALSWDWLVAIVSSLFEASRASSAADTTSESLGTFWALNLSNNEVGLALSSSVFLFTSLEGWLKVEVATGDLVLGSLAEECVKNGEVTSGDVNG